MNKIEGLKERKEKLENLTEFTKQKKKEIIRFVQLLNSGLSSRKITRKEYEEQLKKALKNRTAEQWIKYYDDYLIYYDYQIRLCERLIKQEKAEPRKSKTIYISILIILLLIITLISLVFIFNLQIANFSESVKEKIFSVLQPSKISEESLIQYQAVAGKPVKWKKSFTAEGITGFSVKLPKGSENIKLNKVTEKGKEDIIDIAEVNKKRYLFIFGEKSVEVSINTNLITGNAISDESTTPFSYEIEYETPAPKIEEEIVGNGKRIIITGPDDVHYKNVLSFAELPIEISNNEIEKIKLYQIKDGQRQKIKFIAYDTNENNLYDYIEWITPELSEAEFLLIIEISKAEHLDENKNFISDIYEQVKALDENWSEPISENEFIRVTFKQKLDNTRDITFYPRVVSGNPKIEVYEVNGTEKLAEFTSLSSDKYNKILLTNLQEEQDVFDLRVVGGSIEIEHIIDPDLNIRSGTDTTSASGTATISFTTNMPSSNYSALISGQTDTDTMYSLAYLNKANTGFSVKAEDDSGTNEAGNFEWMAVEFGDYIFGSNAIKCGAGPGGGGTITFSSPFSSTNYAVMASSIDDSDSPLVNFVAGSKTAGSFQIDVEDDTGANEAVTITNYCAFTIGEYNLSGIRIKAGTSTTSTSGDTTINFGSSFTSTNYAVIAMAQAVNGNLCAPERVTKNAGSFTIHFENDAGANCASRNFDWIVVELGEFIIDTTPPNVTVTSPINETSYYASSMNFNLSVADNTGVSSCWYTLDSGTTNYTMSNTTASVFNATNSSIADGTYTAKFYCNDTSNNVNNTEQVTFTIDTTLISRYYPPNATGNIGWICGDNTNPPSNGAGNFSCDVGNNALSSANLNIISSDDTDNINYGGGGTSKISGHKICFNISENKNTITELNIKIRGYGDSYTGPSTHTYSYFLYAWNGTSWGSALASHTLNSTQNSTAYLSAKITSNIPAYVNDSNYVCILVNSGLSGTSVNTAYLYYVQLNVIATISDTVPPIITVISPINGTTYPETTVQFNVSLNENTSWCGFSLNNAANITMTKFNDTYFNFINTTMTNNKQHNVVFACNDTLGNMNSSSGLIYFSVNANTPPAATLNSPEDGSIEVSVNPILNVTLTDLDNDIMNVSFYGRKVNKDNFTIIVFPDVNTGIYYNAPKNQTQWITDNKDALNIQFVIGLGDILELESNISEWESISQALKILDDAGIPNSVLPGNHEHTGWGHQHIYGQETDENAISPNFDKYFNVSRYNSTAWWGGSYLNLTNSYYLKTIGGEDYIFISLGWCPTSAEIAWADSVLTYYSNRKAIISTHGYLDELTNSTQGGSSSGTGVNNCDRYSIAPNYGNTTYIWDMIKTHLNVQIVLCGHEHETSAPDRGERKRTDLNNAEKPVYQMLSDFQDSSSAGYLRILTFDPTADKIYVKTYSTYLDSYQIDANSQFELDYEMSSDETFENLANITNIQNGSPAEYNWTGREYNTTYEWYVNVIDSTGNSINSTIWNFTTLSPPPNYPPQITYISEISPVDPIEASFASVNFNITITDSNEASDINTSSVKANFTKTGEETRQNNCIHILGEDTEFTANFSCTIDMWYFDAPGIWNISVYAEDLNGNSTVNSTTSFKYNQLQAMVISPSSLSWPDIISESINQTPSISTIINNTGNYEGSIIIRASDLYGELTSGFIDARNFVADTDSGTDACDGTALQNGSYITIAGSMLNKGPTAQEEIFYCIPKVPIVSAQTYSTKGTPWIIFFAVLITIKKKKQKAKKIAENDKLMLALNLIADELREAYSLNKKEIIEIIIEKLRTKYGIGKKEITKFIREKQESIPIEIFSKNLGALESVSKYLKENLNFNYKEIAGLLKRDERTIWTAYQKSIKKQKEPIEIKETKIQLPIQIFTKNLTILESAVVYLKNKGLKYVEIAKLLNRDQRNIWTAYSRAFKKVERTKTKV